MMAGARRSAVGAKAEEAGREKWVATIMLPTSGAAEWVREALEGANMTCRTASRQRLFAQSGSRPEVRLNLFQTRTPGSEVANFVLGLTAHIRDRAKRRDEKDADRLCARVNSVTQAIANIVAPSASSCDVVATTLLRLSRGAAFDLWRVYMPNGIVVMDFEDRGIHAAHLVPFVRSIVLPEPLAEAKLPQPRSTSVERWGALDAARRSSLTSASAIKYQLGRYRSFVDAGFEPKTRHARRQHELAAFIDEAKTIVVFEAQKPAGLTKAAIKSAYRLCERRGGLIVDEYGVYDGGGDILFAPWSNRLAPMPNS